MLILLQNDDAGEYKCIATNEAGSSEGFAYLTVRGNDSFEFESLTLISYYLMRKGFWKYVQRFLFYDETNIDAYSLQVSWLGLCFCWPVPPTFKVEPPQTLTIDGGSTVVLNCVAEAEPAPEMVWKKERRNLPTEDRISIMPNNSLR